MLLPGVLVFVRVRPTPMLLPGVLVFVRVGTINVVTWGIGVCEG